VGKDRVEVWILWERGSPAENNKGGETNPKDSTVGVGTLGGTNPVNEKKTRCTVKALGIE